MVLVEGNAWILWHVIMRMINVLKCIYFSRYVLLLKNYSGMTVSFSDILGFASAFGFLIQKMNKIPHCRIA